MFRRTGVSAASGGAHPCSSAGDLAMSANAVHAPEWRAVGRRVLGYVESRYFAGVRRQCGVRHERQSRDGMERRLRLFPFHTGVLDPEVRVPALAPIGHSRRVEELDRDVEPADLL